MSRVVCWFSCGAASAYAAYLALEKYGYGPEVELVYCHLEEEHPSNLKFLEEFSTTIGKEIKIIRNERYQGSVIDVIASTKFIKGPLGAPCTRILKKEVRKDYQRHDDVQVFGYTAEEEDRADRFIDSNNDVDTYFPLLEKGISKQQCKDFITSLGIALPMMYQLGYSNNNCVGCVKGGMGYWNAIRKDFPETFERMAKLERVVGHSVLKDKDGAVYLDELDPDRGNFKRDMPGDCGFSCEWKQEVLL